MTDEDWQSGFAKSIGVFLNGDAIPSPTPRGERVVDDSFLVLFNAHHEPLDFTLPAAGWGERWVRMLDTADAFNEGETVAAGASTTVDSPQPRAVPAHGLMRAAHVERPGRDAARAARRPRPRGRPGAARRA